MRFKAPNKVRKAETSLYLPDEKLGLFFPVADSVDPPLPPAAALPLRCRWEELIFFADLVPQVMASLKKVVNPVICILCLQALCLYTFGRYPSRALNLASCVSSGNTVMRSRGPRTLTIDAKFD